MHICVEATVEDKFENHNDRVWFMWHLAYLISHKWKKFPDIAAFKAKRDKTAKQNKKPVDGINEGAIMAWLASAKMGHDEKKAKK